MIISNSDAFIQFIHVHYYMYCNGYVGNSPFLFVKGFVCVLLRKVINK